MDQYNTKWDQIKQQKYFYAKGVKIKEAMLEWKRFIIKQVLSEKLNGWKVNIIQCSNF